MRVVAPGLIAVALLVLCAFVVSLLLILLAVLLLLLRTVVLCTVIFHLLLILLTVLLLDFHPMMIWDIAKLGTTQWVPEEYFHKGQSSLVNQLKLEQFLIQKVGVKLWTEVIEVEPSISLDFFLMEMFTLTLIISIE